MKLRTAPFAGLLSLTVLAAGCGTDESDDSTTVSLDEHLGAHGGTSGRSWCHGFGNHGSGGADGIAGKLGSAGSDGIAGKLGSTGSAGTHGGGGAGGTASSCPTPPGGMVSWWHADGNYNDAVGSNNGATGGDVTFAPGEINLGFLLDGATSSHVTIPDSPSLEITGAITIDAWINSSTLNGRIVDKITAFGTDGYLLDLVGGQLRMIVQGDGLSSPGPLSPGVFTHVAGVYDGSSLSLYLNGVLVATKATGVTAIPVNSDPLNIGVDSAGGSNFTGIIDEPRIFGRALSAAEIAGIVQAEAAHCQ